MSKELVEEIMQLERTSEEHIRKAEHDAEQMIRKAKEKAMLLVQQAEHSLDTERQQLIAAHDKTIHSQKEQAARTAREEAQKLEGSTKPKINSAATLVVGRFAEYVKNDLS